MNKRIAILGPGAIGSSIGADLTQAGYDVQLIDQWPAHVEAMKKKGLHITMPAEAIQVPVSAMHLCDLRSLKHQFDIIFLTAKSYDTCWMVELMKPYLRSDGVLVSAQNSLNDEWISPIIGPERDIACVLELSAELYEPGLVKRNTDRTATWFALGELDGRITPRLKELTGILGAVGRADVTANIWGAKWTKFTLNTRMAITAIAGVSIWETSQNARLHTLAVKLGREAMRVGEKLGVTFEPIIGVERQDSSASPEEVVERVMLQSSHLVGKTARNCIQQDLVRGRLTEAGYFNGLVVERGRQVGVPTPLNEAVISLMKEIEDGKRQTGLSNLDMLEQHL